MTTPQLDELLQDTPKLAVIIDTFEQRVQRPFASGLKPLNTTAARRNNPPSKAK